MVEKRDLLRSPPALGTWAVPPPSLRLLTAPTVYTVAEPDAPEPGRFVLTSRTGIYRSYPYSMVGLIESPAPDRLVLNCTGGGVEKITITGRDLDRLAELFSAKRLVSLAESDQSDFAKDGVVVMAVVVSGVK